MKRYARMALLVASAALIASGCANPSDDDPLTSSPGPSEDNPVDAGPPDPDDPPPSPDPRPDDPDEEVPDPVPTSWDFSPVYGVPNLDADDSSEIDWYVYLYEGDDDVSTFTIPADLVSAGDEVVVTLTGDTDAIRVWYDGEPLVGSAAHDNALTATITADGNDIVLPIEFGYYNVVGALELEHRDGSGTTIESTSVELRSSPLILNNHLQPSEHLWSVDMGSENADLIDTYQSVLGPAFTAVPGQSVGWDVWIQDEFEFATSTGKGGLRMDTVIDSVRNRGLDAYGPNLQVPDRTRDTWGDPDYTTTYDSFGNLDASPPVTVDGVSYPFGRIYYGRKNGEGIQLAMADFLSSQSVQEPFALDTTWLCVGHVDEFSSFVPDSSSPKGFKLLLADTRTAYDIIDSMNPGTSLPRYAADHGYSTAGEISGDDPLRDLNEDLQSDYLDPIKEKFKAELGLTDDDIILVPTLFEVVPNCGGGVVAITPGMVNLMLANDSSGQTHLFIPDPFMRTNDFDQSADPVLADLASKLPEDLELHFVDDWDTYHINLGEVHCGSNVTRTPLKLWWLSAMHLLSGGL